MDNRIKNGLGWVIGFAVLAIAYAALSYVSSYDKSIQPSSFRSFSVTGQGKATAIPDIAEFSFEVVTEGGNDITTLQTQNTNAVNKAIAFVKSEGVAENDIKTQYYNVDPRYQTYNCVTPPIINGAQGTVSDLPVQACPPASIAGYTITQSIDVKIRDFTKIGDIMNGVVASGANQVGQLTFTLDDPTTVQNTARADAIAKAKTEAQAIAQAGGFKIGRLLSIQEGGGYNYAPENSYAGGISMAVDSLKSVPSPVVQPGSQEVDMTETLQYEIQ